MKIHAAELRRRLGSTAFALWLRLLEVRVDGKVSASRDDMVAWGFTPKQVRAGLRRLQAAGLVSRPSGRASSRDVFGELRDAAAKVPTETAAWVDAASSWGGARSGAGRRGLAESRRGVYSHNQVGSQSSVVDPLEKDGPNVRDGGIKWVHNGVATGSCPESLRELAPVAVGIVDPLEFGNEDVARASRSQLGSFASDRSTIRSLRSLIVDVAPARRRARMRDAAGDAIPRWSGGGVEEVNVNARSEVAIRRRGLQEVLRLPIVPTDRLPNGERAELAVRSPEAPDADPTLSERDVLDRVDRLWRDVTAIVLGAPDMRMRGVSTGKGGRYRAAVLDWWAACAEHGVKPAEWLAWELRWWKSNRASGAELQLLGPMSAKRVRDGKVRRLFRISAPKFGGRVSFDRAGREFLTRLQLLTRRLDRLVVETAGLATDADVESVVRELFPRGVENASRIVEDVSAWCMTENVRLRDHALRGAFVWGNEQ